MAGEAAAAKSVQVNQIKLSIGLKDIDTIKVVDTDFVLQLKSGKKIVIRDGALKAMLDPELTIQFSDTGLKASNMLKMIGPVVPDAASAYTTKDVAAPATAESAVQGEPATKNPESGVGGSASSAVDAASPTAAPSDGNLLVNDKLQKLEALVEKQIEQIDALRSRLESVAELPALQTSIAPAAASSGFLSGISPAWGALGALGAVGGVAGGGTSTAGNAPALNPKDFIAPEALGLSLVQDTGSSFSDSITVDGTFQINALAEGNSWQYSMNYDSDNVAGAKWTDATTSTYFVVPDGVYPRGSIAVRQKSSSGVLGAVAVYNSPVVVDSGVPLKPEYAFDDDATGGSTRDGITANTTIRVSKLEPGINAQYTLGRDGNGDGLIDWYDMTINSDGTSNIVMDMNLEVGKFQIRQMDKAGNAASSATNDQAWIFVKSVTAGLVADTGNDAIANSKGDYQTKDNRLLVTGLVVGSTYRYSTNNGNDWQSFTADAESEGSYTITLADNTTYPAQSIKIQQVLNDGATILRESVIAYEIRTDNSIGSITNVILTKFTQLTGAKEVIDDTSLTNVASNQITVSFEKATEKGETLRYRRSNSASWLKTITLAQGITSYTLQDAFALDLGANGYVFEKMDAAGNTSSVEYTATLDQTAPVYNDLKMLTTGFDGGASNSFYSFNSVQKIKFSIGESLQNGDRILAKTSATGNWVDITDKLNKETYQVEWEATLVEADGGNKINNIKGNSFEIAIADQAGNIGSTLQNHYIHMNSKLSSPVELRSFWEAAIKAQYYGETNSTAIKNWQLLMDAQFTRKTPNDEDYAGTLFGGKKLPEYINKVTNTDIVDQTELKNGFEIKGKANGAIRPRFFLDNDRTDGADNKDMVELQDGVNGITITWNGDEFTITFSAESDTIKTHESHNSAGETIEHKLLKPSDGKAGSGIHKLLVDSNGDGDQDVGEASRLFLVAQGTASSSGANYSAQDVITKNIFVYFNGDPDGAGIGIWGSFQSGLTADDVRTIGTTDPWTSYRNNIDGLSYNGTNSFEYYADKTRSTEKLFSAYTSNIPSKLFEFSAALLDKSVTSTVKTINSAHTEARNNTNTNSNTSRLVSTEEMLAIYAANFRPDGTVGNIDPMSHATQTSNSSAGDSHVPVGWDAVSGAIGGNGQKSYATAGYGYAYDQAGLLVSLYDGTLFELTVSNGDLRVVAVL